MARSLNVWALAPGTALDDLTSTPIPGPVNLCQGRGASGRWECGFSFSGHDDFIAKLRNGQVHPQGGGAAVAPRDIARLGINAHGLPGRVFIDGGTEAPLSSFPPRTLIPFTETIEAFTRPEGFTDGGQTHRGSIIIFAGCLVGSGGLGSEFLIRCSNAWPGRRVVGFTQYLIGESQQVTVPLISGNSYRQTICLYPDAFATGYGPGFTPRDVGRSVAQTADAAGVRSRFSSILPMADENSPIAKIALNGRIVQWPQGESPAGRAPSLTNSPVAHARGQRTPGPAGATRGH